MTKNDLATLDALIWEMDTLKASIFLDPVKKIISEDSCSVKKLLDNLADYFEIDPQLQKIMPSVFNGLLFLIAEGKASPGFVGWFRENQERLILGPFSEEIGCSLSYEHVKEIGGIGLDRLAFAAAENCRVGYNFIDCYETFGVKLNAKHLRSHPHTTLLWEHLLKYALHVGFDELNQFKGMFPCYVFHYESLHNMRNHIHQRAVEICMLSGIDSGHLEAEIFSKATGFVLSNIIRPSDLFLIAFNKKEIIYASEFFSERLNYPPIEIADFMDDIVRTMNRLLPTVTSLRDAYFLAIIADELNIDLNPRTPIEADDYGVDVFIDNPTMIEVSLRSRNMQKFLTTEKFKEMICNNLLGYDEQYFANVLKKMPTSIVSMPILKKHQLSSDLSL